MVGLDIGSAAVKAIELSQRGRDVEVSAFGQIELGSDSEEEKSRAVRDLMGEGGFKTKRLVTGLSGKAVIIRYLTLVRMSDEELKNAITFEAEKYVPFPLDECVLDCQRLDGDDGRGSTMTVLMVAAKRSTVDEHMRTVNASGLVSEIIDVDAFALANAHALCARQDETLDTSGTIAFVDVGFNRTQVNIVSEGVSLFAREISIGGKDFTDAIAKRLSVGFDEAEELKRDPGEGEDTVRDAVFPTIDDLGNEIHLSFDYFQNQFEREISRIMLSGGGSRIGFFREAFERIFEKPTAIFNPFDHLPVGEGINADLLVCNGPQLVVATGLAARMARAS
jgi:type IV pilus assembly protein PilM